MSRVFKVVSNFNTFIKCYYIKNMRKCNVGQIESYNISKNIPPLLLADRKPESRIPTFSLILDADDGRRGLKAQRTKNIFIEQFEKGTSFNKYLLNLVDSLN